MAWYVCQLNALACYIPGIHQPHVHVYFINTLTGDKVIQICFRNVICPNTESSSVSLVDAMRLLFCIVVFYCQVMVEFKKTHQQWREITYFLKERVVLEESSFHQNVLLVVLCSVKKKFDVMTCKLFKKYCRESLAASGMSDLIVTLPDLSLNLQHIRPVP